MSTPTAESIRRVFDLLDVLSEAVGRLSREHESLREDLREIRGMLAAPSD